MREIDIDEALDILAHTAEDYAVTCGRVCWYEAHLKVVKARGFMDARRNGDNVAESEAQAVLTDEYGRVSTELACAQETQVLLRAQRDAAEARVEIWRSMEATRRAENVT